MKIFRYISFLISAYSFSQVDCVKVHSDFSGFCVEYHQNGRISWVKEFANGSATGIWMLFDEKGILVKQFNSNLHKDSLSLSSINDDGWEDPKELKSQIKINAIDEDFWFEPEAEYPGGPKALQIFINQNFKYPQNAIDSGIVGRIYVSFIVEADGELTNFLIYKGIETCPECNEEALRIFRLMPKWIPAINDGKNIRSRMKVPINLTLN
jgi:TonB family protein